MLIEARPILFAIAMALVMKVIGLPASEPDRQWTVYQDWPFSAEQAQRRQQETAKSLMIPVEKSIDLGNGVTMEFVLIPAGRFLMGTPEALQPQGTTLIEILSVATAGGFLMFNLMIAVFRTLWRRKCFQFSLRYMLLIVFAAAVSLLGGVRWWQAQRSMEKFTTVVKRRKAALERETPSHFVTLTAPFYMGKHEVTQDQYREVMLSNPSKFKGAKRPVDWVNWQDCVAFSKRLSEHCGNSARLPTEAEWEYACRAGAIENFHFGDSESDLPDFAWYGKRSSSGTTRVGMMEPNPFGCYDMHGNVWEWCQDWFGAYDKSPATDPRGPASGDCHVLRGGSWCSTPNYCRSAHRLRAYPDLHEDSFGFRVLLGL